MADAIACAALPPSLLFAAVALDVVGGLVLVGDAGGFQLRKEVQILQGLPSGPSTVPGGRGRVIGVEPGDCDGAVEAFVLLPALAVGLIVASCKESQVGDGGTRNVGCGPAVPRGPVAFGYRHNDFLSPAVGRGLGMGRVMWVGTMARRVAKGLVGAAHACRLSVGHLRSVLSVGPFAPSVAREARKGYLQPAVR